MDIIDPGERNTLLHYPVTALTDTANSHSTTQKRQPTKYLIFSNSFTIYHYRVITVLVSNPCPLRNLVFLYVDTTIPKRFVLQKHNSTGITIIFTTFQQAFDTASITTYFSQVLIRIQLFQLNILLISNSVSNKSDSQTPGNDTSGRCFNLLVPHHGVFKKNDFGLFYEFIKIQLPEATLKQYR